MPVINVTPDLLHQLENLAALNQTSVVAVLNGLADYYTTYRAQFEEPRDPEERAALLEALLEEQQDPTTYSEEEVREYVNEFLMEYAKQKRGAA